jgi:FkbM family methyltransferase
LRSIFRTLRFITTHPLGSRRPLRAFWRFSRWQIESRLRPEVEFEWIEGSRLIVRNGMTGATGNIYCGLHEFVDMAFLLHLLRVEDHFVDGGSNIGSYSVLASAVCGSRSTAIEPDPDTMRSLRRNVVANNIQDRVTLIEAALGSEAGTVNFTVGNDTTNRVATEADGKTRRVGVRTLDDILDRESPALIKLDVEGYETKVLRGAMKTLQQPSLLAVLIETVDEEARNRLQQVGFSEFTYDPFSRQLSRLSKNGRQVKSKQNSLYIREVDTCRKRVETACVRHVFDQKI